MVLGPGGRYPLEVRPDQPSIRATIHANQSSVVSLCGFLSFSGTPFAFRVDGTQGRHVSGIDRVGDRPADASVAGHDKLYRAHRRDQTDDGQFGEARGSFPLSSSILRQSSFIEHLLDDPSHTIPGDILSGLIERCDRMRGHQPPMDRLGASGWIDFLGVDHSQRDCSGLVFVQ